MMPKKTDEPQIKEIKPSALSISPIFSNNFAISTQDDIVIIDYGFVSRAYCSPNEIEDKQVASICIPWDTIEYLSKTLREILADHKKEINSKNNKNIK
ncbi:MAG: hypothetical protein PHQ86_08940 [Dehalococcoidales bacterium]|nr:hypothetical protein [Dehalococcoidales bacterium]